MERRGDESFKDPVEPFSLFSLSTREPRSLVTNIPLAEAKDPTPSSSSCPSGAFGKETSKEAQKLSGPTDGCSPKRNRRKGQDASTYN